MYNLGAFGANKAADVDPYADIVFDSGTAAFSFPFDEQSDATAAAPPAIKSAGNHTSKGPAGSAGSSRIVPDEDSDESENFETLEAFLNAGKKKKAAAPAPAPSVGILRSGSGTGSEGTGVARADKTLRWSIEGDAGKTSLSLAAKDVLTAQSDDRSNSSSAANESDDDVGGSSIFGKVQHWSDFQVDASRSPAPPPTTTSTAPVPAATALSSKKESSSTVAGTTTTRTNPPNPASSRMDDDLLTSSTSVAKSQVLLAAVAASAAAAPSAHAPSATSSVVEENVVEDEYSEISEEIPGLHPEHSVASQSYIDDFDEYEATEQGGSASPSPTGSSSMLMFGQHQKRSSPKKARTTAEGAAAAPSPSSASSRGGSGNDDDGQDRNRKGADTTSSAPPTGAPRMNFAPRARASGTFSAQSSPVEGSESDRGRGRGFAESSPSASSSGGGHGSSYAEKRPRPAEALWSSRDNGGSVAPSGTEDAGKQAVDSPVAKVHRRLNRGTCTPDRSAHRRSVEIAVQTDPGPPDAFFLGASAHFNATESSGATTTQGPPPGSHPANAYPPLTGSYMAGMYPHLGYPPYPPGAHMYPPPPWGMHPYYGGMGMMGYPPYGAGSAWGMQQEVGLGQLRREAFRSAVAPPGNGGTNADLKIKLDLVSSTLAHLL